MPDPTTFMMALAVVVVIAPAGLLLALGVPSLIAHPLSEGRTVRITRGAIAISLSAAICVFVGMLVTGDRHVSLDLGNWVSLTHTTHTEPSAATSHGAHYEFTIKFVFDRLSVPFVILTLVLCGTVSHFAAKYLHHERGYNRFFVLMAIFVLGMVSAALADTIETLFIGWELVGLSSALLVAFFHDRPAPVRNGLWVWAVYRLTDVSLVLAAIAMHILAGNGDFDCIFGVQAWPEGHTSLNEPQAFLIGLLLLGAAVGKSALVPLSGWLPRAMEGPTPSSAIFYGALSVHFGAFLLLRATPLLEVSAALAVVVITLGLITALFAYVTGAVQTDIKSALSFASLTQVGIIVAEIGVGRWVPFLWYVALVHLLGHACLRTMQFLRAPSILQDYRHLENAIGSRLKHGVPIWVRLSPVSLHGWLYRFALERGYLDTLLVRFIVHPFVSLFQWFDAAERRWTNQLNGQEQPPTTPPQIASTPTIPGTLPVPATPSALPPEPSA